MNPTGTATGRSTKKLGPLEQVPTGDSASILVDLLSRGEINGMVRGTLSTTRVMRRLAKTFEIRVRRLSLLAPVGIDEGDTISDRLNLAVMGAEYPSPRRSFWRVSPETPASGPSTGASSSRPSEVTT